MDDLVDPLGTKPQDASGCGGQSNLVSGGTCSTATVTPQKLLDDARALHDTVGVGTRADRATTVATGQLGGELVYAVNQNGTSRAMRALAGQLGYERVFATELTQTHSTSPHGCRTNFVQCNR
jgi:hypothetical protein